MFNDLDVVDRQNADSNYRVPLNFPLVKGETRLIDRSSSSLSHKIAFHSMPMATSL